jgi:hypothetical protein
MPLAVFANDAFTTATSTYGTTSPASGTSESWVMTSNAGFPVASASAVPSTWWHLVDQALPSETIAVTANPSASWTVTRGAEGTTPVAHAAGATYYAVVSAGDLAGFAPAGASIGGVTTAGLGLGLLSVSPSYIAASLTASNEQLVVALATCTQGKAVTTLGALVTTAGVTAGAGVNELALFTEAGTLVAQTGDMTTAFGTLGYAEGPIANPGAITSFTLIAGANYYLAILPSFTGTQPHFEAVSSTPQTYALNGHYISRFLNSQATMPGTITPSSMSAQTSCVMAYARLAGVLSLGGSRAGRTRPDRARHAPGLP